jgi:hypothetical protein
VLKRARTGGKMSGCNMLKQANMLEHIRLQHARTGCNIMLCFVTTSQFYGLLDAILFALQAKLEIF